MAFMYVNYYYYYYIIIIIISIKRHRVVMVRSNDPILINSSLVRMKETEL